MMRRDVLISLAAGLAAPFADIAASQPSAVEVYRRALVIDAQGSAGDFDPAAANDAPLSARAVADVKSSGITAVNVTVGSIGNGPHKFEETVEQIAYWDREIAAHPDIFLKVRNADDLGSAKTSNRTGLIFGFQDTCMLEGDLARLTLFRGLGVLVIQPTYNRRTLMGDGCLEAADGGLSALGHEFIAEMNRQRILLDLSHAGVRTTAEGIAACRAPAAITHTGCRALADSPRNMPDRELKALAERGGVAGIYLMPFLRSSGQPHAEDVVRHLEYAVNCCGEDHVGLGTDGTISAIRIDAAYREYQKRFFTERNKAGIAAPGEAADVFNLVPEYNVPRRLEILATDLAHRGWSDRRIEKILGANFARLFKDVWGA